MAQYSYLKIQGPFVRTAGTGYLVFHANTNQPRKGEYRGIDGTRFKFYGTEMDLMMHLGQHGYRLLQRTPNSEADIFIFEKVE